MDKVTIILFGFLFLIFFLYIIINPNLEENINKCMDAGYTKTYCQHLLMQ